MAALDSTHVGGIQATGLTCASGALRAVADLLATGQVRVVIDRTYPLNEAADALGYVSDPPPEGHDTWETALAAFGVPEDKWNSAWALSDPDGRGPRLYFQRVPEAKTAKNRVHLDLRAAPALGALQQARAQLAR